MTAITNQQIDKLFPIVVAIMEEDGPIKFVKDDIKKKIIKIIDGDLLTAITEARKSIETAVDDKLTSEHIGMIANEIIKIKTHDGNLT